MSPRVGRRCGVGTNIVPAQETFHADTRITSHPNHRWIEAKATAIRVKDLSQIESEAQSRSETMVLPVALMFAGFLVLIGYPALAALSSP